MNGENNQNHLYTLSSISFIYDFIALVIGIITLNVYGECYSLDTRECWWILVWSAFHIATTSLNIRRMNNSKELVWKDCNSSPLVVCFTLWVIGLVNFHYISKQKPEKNYTIIFYIFNILSLLRGFVVIYFYKKYRPVSNNLQLPYYKMKVLG